ncbi:MAG: UDP-2,4-diacetamido-2,4,6-trideoxy-beta-L-altropyranose hydrolase [Candidatus Parcubacteria bacterium]|nr:UDP-2,4-diacetamido-2,4,6-trideoxy-beta-L-altropyranose hydrolase [Burkholderiales bacterium]
MDASQRIGIGHAMRCLALADAIRDRNTVEFACRQQQGDLCAQIEQQGYVVHRLPPPSADATEASDAEETLAAIRTAAAASPNWLIVDHYGLGALWHAALRPHAGRILVIDDLADRAHDCDLLLDQNLSPADAGRYASRVPAGCRVLAGPRYALLRDEFQRLRGKCRPRTTVQRVLVSFGGADAANLTERALAAMSLAPLSDLQFDVFIGPAFAHAGRIRELCAALPSVRLWDDPGRLAERMAEADLAIGAAGSSFWERACLGLPSIAVPVAPNQDYVARRSAAEGAAIVLALDKFDAATLAAAVARLTADPEKLLSMSVRCFDLADGSGAGRVAQLLEQRPVELRRATLSDAALVYPWRNSERVRRASHDSGALEPARHEEWFRASLAVPARDLLIAEVGKVSIGVLRYDVDGPRATVSIYLAPDWIGRGYGAEVLKAGHAWLGVHRPVVVEVRAEILAENSNSMSTFLQAGYRGTTQLMVWSAGR